MQSRKPIISFLQAFGILLVVMGHSTYGAPETPAWNACMHTFRMPLFMFLSGFLLRYSYEARNKSLSDTPLYGSKGFIWKKVKRLLVPYVVISSLAFLPKSLLNQYASRPVDVSFPEYVRMLFYPWDNVIVFFWFLPTLFLIFMLVIYGARWLRGLDRPLFHVLLMGAALGLNLFNPLEEVGFLNLSGVVSYFLYFYAGYWFARLHLLQWFERHPLCGAVISLVLLIALFVGLPAFVGKEVLMAACGIALCIYLGALYVRHDCHFLDHLFGASYAIYLFSWFPQVASQQVLLSITHWPWQVGGVLAMITGVYVPFLLYKLIVRYKPTRIGRVVALLTGQ